MNLFQVMLLSIVQGFTEFLPISSSGHLAIFQKILGFTQPVVVFDILLHVGSLLAILLFFNKKLLMIFSKKYLILLGIGTVPAILFSLLFDKTIETTFSSMRIIGILFIINAVILLSTKFIHPKTKNQRLKASDQQPMTNRNALLIGISQAIAILPSVSRSGATITSALWLGIQPVDAFEFSFFLAIPAIIGAFVFKIKDVAVYGSQDLVFGIVGMLVSMVISYFALGLLQRVLKSANFFWFGIYCGILGLILLIM
jgi:undecaprenyl-diphosphatase